MEHRTTAEEFLSDADQRKIAAYDGLVAALQQIAANAPAEEPDAEDYDDTESASIKGAEVGAWQAAQIARAALAQFGEG